MQIIKNVFTEEELKSLNNNKIVIENRDLLLKSGKSSVSFTLLLDESLKSKIITLFNLSCLEVLNEIPIRWVQGDIQSHKDVGSSNFKRSHLIYLNDNNGVFILENNSYPITANTAFIFPEGVLHKTENTGTEPRLILGPMNEFMSQVGLAGIVSYYPTQSDALAVTNSLGNGAAYTVGDCGPQVYGIYNYWKIASNSSGSSSKSNVYSIGDNLNNDGTYYLYPFIPESGVCFPENTQITTDQGVVCIEKINIDTHTIRNKKILAITRTRSPDNYLVCFEKDSLALNYPSEKTIMSKDHKFYYRGNLTKAQYFLSQFKSVKRIPYHGEIIYNILLEDYSFVKVNNLICETLHPRNIIAKLYNSNLSKEMKHKIVTYLNHHNNSKIC